MYRSYSCYTVTTYVVFFSRIHTPAVGTKSIETMHISIYSHYEESEILNLSKVNQFFYV